MQLRLVLLTGRLVTAFLDTGWSMDMGGEHDTLSLFAWYGSAISIAACFIGMLSKNRGLDNMDLVWRYGIEIRVGWTMSLVSMLRGRKMGLYDYRERVHIISHDCVFCASQESILHQS